MRSVDVIIYVFCLVLADWPEDLKVFEIRPSTKPLLFVGDSVPIDCVASNNDLHGIHWYRQGLKVVTNSTANIVLQEDHSDPATLTLTLRYSIYNL